MTIDIVRAWKDDNYRQQLSEAQLANLPANPAGATELSDEQLEGAGGNDTAWCSQSGTFCTSFCTCNTKSLLCGIC